MIKKCGLTDGQLILVYCSIIRDQIESVQKRALKIISHL